MDITFNQMLAYFPEVELPVTLTEDSIDLLKEHLIPMPNAFVESYLKTWEGGEIDEFTEFTPLMQIDKNDQYLALIYWKASLLRYEYILVTTSPKGDLIAMRSIAGLISDGEIMMHSVARIDTEMNIHIMTSAQYQGRSYSSENAQSFLIEIAPNGELIFSSE